MIETYKISMRLFLLAMLYLSTSMLGWAQEFYVQKNGLIYSEQTMNRLHRISDSLNIHFKQCEVRTTWKAFEQTYGFYYYSGVSDSMLKPLLIEAMLEGKSKKEIEEIGKNTFGVNSDTLLLIKYDFFEEDSAAYLTNIAHLGEDDIIESDMTFSRNKINTAKAKDGGIWYWKVERNYWSKSNNLYFYYCLSPFKENTIPLRYNDWINYSQCMVDTNTSVYTKNAKGIGGWRDSNQSCEGESSYYQDLFNKKVDSIDYTVEEPEEPRWYRGKNKDSMRIAIENRIQFDLRYNEWKEKKLAYTSKELYEDPNFPVLAYNAWKEAKTNDCFSLTFVENLGNYYNKSLALDLKRSRYKIGICSRDGSPRAYLAEIASLSADAGRWDIFLRAHLDIMNDRVQRNSDNSVMLRYRGVYVKELEALGIDCKKLFLGMMFRIDQAPEHHYYNTLTRSAKAMSLSKDSLRFVALTLEVAGDPSVDVFNRIVFAHVYNNLIYYRNLKKKEQLLARRKLHKALKDLPAFVQTVFHEELEDE